MSKLDVKKILGEAFKPKTLEEAFNELTRVVTYSETKLYAQISGVCTSGSYPTDPELRKIMEDAVANANEIIQKKLFAKTYDAAKTFIRFYEADNKS